MGRNDRDYPNGCFRLDQRMVAASTTAAAAPFTAFVRLADAFYIQPEAVMDPDGIPRPVSGGQSPGSADPHRAGPAKTE